MAKHKDPSDAGIAYIGHLFQAMVAYTFMDRYLVVIVHRTIIMHVKLYLCTQNRVRIFIYIYNILCILYI